MRARMAYGRRLNRLIEKSAAEFDRKIAESRAEFDRSIAESRAEFDRKMAESKAADDARRKAEADARKAEADERNAEFDARYKKMHEEIFGVGQNSGYHAEQFFRNVLEKYMVFGGKMYNRLLANAKHVGRESCEFDVLMVNGESVALIEIKNRIHPAFIKEMVEKKVAQFRKYFPEYERCDLYLGVAGFSFDQKAVEEAEKYGVAVLRQDGETVVETDQKNLKVY